MVAGNYADATEKLEEMHYWTAKAFEDRIRKKVDLHGATPHVFRHTYLTTAAGENIDPKTLQSMAGHADHQVTMNVYVHPKKENVAKAGQMMDALLGSYADAS